MPFLNIPLSGTKTARHHRRAVWKWGILLSLLVLIFVASRLHSTKNPFLSFIPKETSFFIHLRPNTTQWAGLLQSLGSETIIDGFTLRDTAQLSQGSIGLFVTKQGQRILGIQGELSSTTQTTLQTYGYTLSTPSEGLWFISNEIIETNSSTKRTPLLKRLTPGFAGEIVALDTESPPLTIQVFHQQIAILIPKVKKSAIPPPWKEAQSLSMSFSAINPVLFPNFLNTYFASLSGETTLTDLVGSTPSGFVSLGSSGDFLLFLEQDISNPLLQKLLRFQYSISQPTTKTRILPDGSPSIELRAATELPNIDDLPNTDWVISRMEQPNGTVTFGAKNKENPWFMIGNDPDLLLHVVNQQEQATFDCGNSELFQLNFKAMTSLLQKNTTYFSTAIPMTNTSFVNAGLDKNLFSTKIHLCGDEKVDK